MKHPTALRRLVARLSVSSKAREALDQCRTDSEIRSALTRAFNDWARVCRYTQAEVVAREEASYHQGYLDGYKSGT